MAQPFYQFSLFYTWEYKLPDPNKPPRKPCKQRKKKKKKKKPQHIPGKYEKFWWLKGYIRKIVYADGTIDYVGSGAKQRQIFTNLGYIRKACGWYDKDLKAIGAKQYIVPARIVMNEEGEIEYVPENNEDEADDWTDCSD